MALTPSEHFDKLRVKRIVKNVGDITMGAGGYKQISIPQITGYTCIAVNISNYSIYSGTSTSSAITAAQTTANAYFILGVPNATITNLQVILLYLSNEDFDISTTE